MGHSEDYNKIRKEAENHKITPADEAWTRIEDKLNQNQVENRNQKRNSLRLLTGIAASLILLLAFSTLFYLKDLNKPHEYLGQLESIEEIELRTDYFYSISNARRAQQMFPYRPDASDSSLEGAALLPILFGNNPF